MFSLSIRIVAFTIIDTKSVYSGSETTAWLILIRRKYTEIDSFEHNAAGRIAFEPGDVRTTSPVTCHLPRRTREIRKTAYSEKYDFTGTSKPRVGRIP